MRTILRRQRPCLLVLGALSTVHAFSISPFTTFIKRSTPIASFSRFQQQQQQQQQQQLHQSATSTSSPAEQYQEEEEEEEIASLSFNTSTTITNSNDAATWHKKRRQLMLQRYGKQIIPLERDSCSLPIALPLLILCNTLLLLLSILSKRLSIPCVLAISTFPGSILSLWQLQILHDVVHASFFPKHSSTLLGIQKRTLQNWLLFWASLPNVFGYYLYLKFGHLTHHKNVGNVQHASLQTLFHSNKTDFEDGDVLFVAHRMKLLVGKENSNGPVFQLFGNKISMSTISNSAFALWKRGNFIWNACVFACSFLLERFLLVLNDVVVAVTGKNYFFPNKPIVFHDTCTRYARVATLTRLVLWKFAGWKSLLFLYLSETLWSIPPHFACAMFVTNHGSTMNDDGSNCVPTRSTYAGGWYSLLTLGTNYHVEHHDFPTIPLHKLGQLHTIAPEFYEKRNANQKDNVLAIMKQAFAYPDFYACMNANIGFQDGDKRLAVEQRNDS